MRDVSSFGHVSLEVGYFPALSCSCDYWPQVLVYLGIFNSFVFQEKLKCFGQNPAVSRRFAGLASRPSTPLWCALALLGQNGPSFLLEVD